PRLLAATAHLATHLGIVGAEAGIGQLTHQRLVHYGRIDWGCKDGVAQFDFADLLPVHIFHRYKHGLILLSQSCRSSPYLAFFDFRMALPDSRTTTSVPRAPGMAPRTAIRLRSGSTRATLRFWTVVLALPYWPGARVPGKVWPGVVPAPREPVARWRSDWPCVLGPPAKPWRRTAPEKPRPLETPDTSTNSPSTKTSALTTSPTLTSGAAS